jgi:type II secretory pathway component GspD/PulD (secretin)
MKTNIKPYCIFTWICRVLPGCMLVVSILGCAHTPKAEKPVEETIEQSEDNAMLVRMQQLYDDGAYAEALRLSVEAAQIDPEMPGLEEMRIRILAAMMDQRTVESSAREAMDRRRAVQDATDKGHIPDTYGLRRMVTGSARDQLESESAMWAIMNHPVSIQLQGANLNTLIQALSQDEAINIIADQGIGAGGTVDVNITDVPLREVLDYLSRQFKVQFHAGANIIWVTKTDASSAPPMETRVFRLRTGLKLHGLAWGELPANERLTQSDISALTRKATVLPQESLYLEKIIEKFVPSNEAAQIHFDYNTHTLFVRNTPENLALIAQIVEALDVNPPQVLIEARFIEISQADLREIGIDWILGSPLVLTKKGITEGGVFSRQPNVVVDEGGSIDYTPFRSDSAGAFPLGPQGSFGLVREGNPPTADQGLNISFSGVLTEPMFSAVLHALEISGKGRTLSVPRVTTLNNNPAKLRDGDDLLYYEEFQAQAFALVDANNQKYTVTALIPKGVPKVAELGFTLVAVPSVGADMRTISLLLTPTISELLEFISYQDEAPVLEDPDDFIRQVVVKLPRIARREVQTKVLVDSGETVVMGGLIRTVAQDTEHRVPVLGSLPGIGQLFRRTDVTEERRNLIIFVTATVISERGESLIPMAPESEDEE